MSSIHPQFTPLEKQLEERRKYKQFFTSDAALENFLRLPLVSDRDRLDVLAKLSELHKREENEKQTPLYELSTTTTTTHYNTTHRPLHTTQTSNETEKCKQAFFDAMETEK